MVGPAPFPDVPIAAGVPPVQRGPANSSVTSEAQLTTDSDDVTQMAATQWGIFTQGGVQIVRPDSVVAFGYSAESRIAGYPIEGGSFESYDKVAMPFLARVVMTKGGTLAERQSFHQAVEAIRGDREIYNIITPEAIYASVNIARVELDRSQQRGAGMLAVEIYLQEIRQQAVAAFSSSKSPSAANPVNNGSVQARDSLYSGNDLGLSIEGLNIQ